MCIVPKIRLWDQCLPGDVCSDQYADCLNNVCQCRAGSRDINGTCSKFIYNQ